MGSWLPDRALLPEQFDEPSGHGPAAKLDPRRHVVDHHKFEPLIPFPLPEFVRERDLLLFKRNAGVIPLRMRDAASSDLGLDAMRQKTSFAGSFVHRTRPFKFRRVFDLSCIVYGRAEPDQPRVKL